MAGVVETVPPPCPNPRKHLRRPLWRWIASELALVGFLIVTGLLIWQLFGIRMHMLPVKHEVGDYGVVELPDRIGPGTRILEFAAVRLPTEVVQTRLFTTELGQRIQVTVVYQEPGAAAQTWDKTYSIGCDTRGKCQPLRTLIGVLLYGSDGKGGVVDRAYVHFLTNQRYLPQPSREPEYAVPVPRPLQPALPPGATIAQMSDPACSQGRVFLYAR